jgi:hypothetical protein
MPYHTPVQLAFAHARQKGKFGLPDFKTSLNGLSNILLPLPNQ